MKSKRIFPLLFFIFFLLFSPQILFALRLEQCDLKGAVKEIRYFRADFFNRFGKWELTPFFPFSNPLKEIGDRSFDSDGYCQKLFYLKPDGDSRYSAVYRRSNEGDKIKIEETAFNYLTQSGEKKIFDYDAFGNLQSYTRYLNPDQPEEIRRFYYDKKVVREEAFGHFGHLYEKVFYQYDAQNRCIQKEIRGFPYDMLLSKTTYSYDEQGRLLSQLFFDSDFQLTKKIYFSYDQGELPVQQIIHTYEKKMLYRDYFRFEWKVDEKGNWIEKIEVALIKKGRKWEEFPRTFYRREILYF